MLLAAVAALLYLPLRKYAGIGGGRIPSELLRRPHHSTAGCVQFILSTVDSLSYAKYEVQPVKCFSVRYMQAMSYPTL